MFDTLSDSQKLERGMFGLLSTIMFIIFAAMHISLSYYQYNIFLMNQFNQAVTLSLFPEVEYQKILLSKQFISRNQMQDYFLNDVNERMRGASSNISDKDFFHQQNLLLPYIKLYNVRGKEIECGSTTANWNGKNEALVQGQPYDMKFGYPYNATDRCFVTYTRAMREAELRQKPLNDSNSTVEKYL